MSDITETGICSICGAKYDHFGNNAQPINDGRCCDSCNAIEVIPARIRGFQDHTLPGQHVQRRDK